MIDSTLQGIWQMQPVSGSTSNTVSLQQPTLTFNLSDSTITGNTGCNNLSGLFTVKGDNIAFDEHLIVTKKACPGYNEKAFLENLTQTNKFRINNGTLELLNNEVLLSRWTKTSLASDTTNRL
jgi:heat shock protein HslJ